MDNIYKVMDEITKDIQLLELQVKVGLLSKGDKAKISELVKIAKSSFNIISKQNDLISIMKTKLEAK